MVADDDIFIRYHAIQLYAVSDHGILHDNGVAYDGILADLYAAEQDTVLDLSLNDTAVRDQRIGDDRFAAVF